VRKLTEYMLSDTISMAICTRGAWPDVNRSDSLYSMCEHPQMVLSNKSTAECSVLRLTAPVKTQPPEIIYQRVAPA
jgi:hypothetical protein